MRLPGKQRLVAKKKKKTKLKTLIDEAREQNRATAAARVSEPVVPSIPESGRRLSAVASESANPGCVGILKFFQTTHTNIL